MTISSFISSVKSSFAANKIAKAGANNRFASAVGAVAVGAFLVMPELALAAPWDGAANNILAMLTGGLSRTIAIICVIACGFAALAGKLSWDWAIKIIIGIVLIFGSASIVDYFIAGSSF